MPEQAATTNAWMRKGTEPPIQVPDHEISKRMWDGYTQCEPPADAKKESK